MNRNEQREDYGRHENQRRVENDQHQGGQHFGAENNYRDQSRRHPSEDDRGAGRHGYPAHHGEQSSSMRWEGSHHDYGRDPHRQGERFDNPRVLSSESNSSLEGASRNYGSMGSYGGAQGWGSSRNGAHQDSRVGFNSTSGHGGADNRHREPRQFYGAYRDHNSFAPGEREQYDGTSRYGSQGADATKGWQPSEHVGTSHYSRNMQDNDPSRGREDDSSYEIYDDAQSHYNRGEYGNMIGGGSYLESGFDRRAVRENSAMMGYNAPRRHHFNQEGEGARSENYGNMAGSLSYGNAEDYRSQEGRDRRYDPMSGHIRGQGAQPPSREDFNW
ncbi:hypothetical protein TH61_12140 [Rufibacter sp. DG15C]|uniref:hypothetical protein n=1 Tax=Rufibacter sp. DG15C TaxID=1379909 RepID=UPI00078C61BD|nr:hypothetical protein [Rufibacter sp. DG15C]AMM51777.1 hypothetical protein TH61_12140 [Rufibacter sp. DG15C]